MSLLLHFLSPVQLKRGVIGLDGIEWHPATDSPPHHSYHGFMHKGELRFSENPEQTPRSAIVLHWDLTHAMWMFCHSHHLCFSLVFWTTPTVGHVCSKFFFNLSKSRSSRLDLDLGCNYYQKRCFSSDTILVSSELPETNTSLFYCINILLGHICLDEVGLCHQRMEGGRGSQSASALQTHCFLLQQQTELCPHVTAGEPAASQKEK